MLKRPELGNYVKRFSVSDGPSDGYFKNASQTLNFDDEDEARRRVMMKALGCSNEEVEEWTYDIGSRKWDALMGLILSCLPALQSFDTAAHDGMDWGRLAFVLKTASQLQAQGSESPAAMTQLRSISVLCDDARYEDTMHLDLTLPFLSIKSVTAVHLHGVCDEGKILPESPDLAATTLSFDRSLIRGHALIAFLRRFKRLQKLTYNMSFEGDVSFTVSPPGYWTLYLASQTLPRGTVLIRTLERGT